MCTMKAYVLGLFLINPITLVFMSSPSSFYSLRGLAANEILHLSVKEPEHFSIKLNKNPPSWQYMPRIQFLESTSFRVVHCLLNFP